LRQSAAHPRFQSLDLLATLVAVVSADGAVLFANAALEDALGISRRSISGALLQECFTEPQLLVNALSGARVNEFAALRYDTWLKRMTHDPLPVHVVVAQTDTAGEVIIELLPLEQQTRQEREERLIAQAQANKEMIRNLAP
jgi:two-component system, NtrC family, nitrogen regulation sensor histidine kinase GlnL